MNDLNRKIVKVWLSLILCVPFIPVHGQQSQFAVASAHPLATQAGIEIMQQGGNAFDAAVAVTAALAVAEPSGSGIGGGGFWLLHEAATQTDVMLDGREKAPGNAHRDMYLDENGDVIKGASVNGPLSAGIPGEPAALAWLAQNYGKLSLADSLAPAIRIAEQGFQVGEHFHRLMTFRQEVVQASPAAAEIFLDQGQVPEVGTTIIQKDLANTLRRLAEQGHDGFYKGETAKLLVDGVQAAGGIWTMEDLANYEVVVREPVVAQYKGMQMTSAALPSSGGLVMAQTLNILSGFDFPNLDSTDQMHLVIEAWRRAYRDRAEYMGDADFVDVPEALITSLDYAAGQRQSIRMDTALPSSSLAPTADTPSQGTDTSHFSVVDAEGNRVSATLSINYPFGSGFIAPGTGVFLNDEMDDFSSKPGEPNVYGLVGAEANSIQPNKRMLSSMSPTFLEDENRIAVVGTPGGSRIISMVLLATLAFHDGASAEQMVDLPRYHHQYLPDVVQYEPETLDPELLQALQDRGHTLKDRGRTWGNMHVVIIDKATGKLEAASDKRGEGLSIVSE